MTIFEIEDTISRGMILGKGKKIFHPSFLQDFCLNYGDTDDFYDFFTKKRRFPTFSRYIARKLLITRRKRSKQPLFTAIAMIIN